MLSDALYYATSVYKPKVVIDAATLTGAQAGKREFIWYID